MSERVPVIVEGPVPSWEPTPGDLALIDELLSSEDELDQAYGLAYQHRCFVREIGSDDKGLAAVGEYDVLAEFEFRNGFTDIGPDDVALQDLFEFSYPGRGDSRADRIRDGLRQVLEVRANS